MGSSRAARQAGTTPKKMPIAAETPTASAMAWRLTTDGKSNKISLELRQWQALIDLQARLAEYLREVGEP